MLGISWCVKSRERGKWYWLCCSIACFAQSPRRASAHSQTPIKTNLTLAGFSNGGRSFADHRTSLQLTSLLQVSASNFIQHTRSDPVPTQLGNICRLDHDHPTLLSSSLRLLNANVFPSFTRLRTWICQAQHQAHDPW
jgi:hypothetical protein